MTARCRDWQYCEASDIVPLVEAEARAWLEQLNWNVAESWRVIEPARQAGRLPGLVSYDGEGRTNGWTAFLPHEGHLQVMAVVAPDGPTAGVLADGILASPQSQVSSSTIVCARAGTPGLAGVLRDRGFAVETYRYMSAALDHLSPVPSATLGPWNDHEERMADLCARAYGTSEGVRAFAPGGTLPEWRSYVSGLVRGNGCGWFLPELSVVTGETKEGDVVDHLQAAIMLTDLGPGTVHVAQMAVAPESQGRGLGRQVLQTALAAATRLYQRATLLVASSNTAAVHLYESVGFTDAAQFVVASRTTPDVLS